jgi:AraC family transcriptional regulator
MAAEGHNIVDRDAVRAGGPPLARRLGGGEGWSVRELVCRAGASDPAFEEQHEGYSIAAVVEGSFTYKADAGDAFLYPGALLLGNHGRCFSCGHDHGVGDRCVALSFTPDAFAEIAAAAAGSSRYRFAAPALAAGGALIPTLARIEAIAADPSPLRLEETASGLAERVVAAASGHVASRAAPSNRDRRRIADVTRYIEDHAAEPLDLAALAAIGRSSKYHFLRVFRRVVGMTPYQYLLNVRIRRAAVRLLGSPDTVAAVAFEAGFGDLSTFNDRFREVFGASPSAFRRRGGL